MKTVVLHVRVSEKQKRAIAHAAKQAGMNVSQWLRWISHVESGGVNGRQLSQEGLAK